MNFVNRFQGVFFNPQQTFKALSEKPVWKDGLIILLVAAAIFAYLIAPYSHKDNVQFFENSVKLKERMGEERFNAELEKMRNAPRNRILMRSVLPAPITLAVGFLISSLVILVMGRLTSTEGKYVQVFSCYLYANFIDKILGNALRLLLILSRKSVMQTTTSLSLLFPRLEVTSPTYIVLSQVDFFQLWLFGIFGFALSYIFKIDFRKALFISYGFWVIKSILYIVMGLIALRMTG